MRRYFMSRRMQAVGIRMARDLAWRRAAMSDDDVAAELRAMTIATPSQVRRRMVEAFNDECNLLRRARWQ